MYFVAFLLYILELYIKRKIICSTVIARKIMYAKKNCTAIAKALFFLDYSSTVESNEN